MPYWEDNTRRNSDQDFSLKELFVPLTTVKAVTIIVIVGIIVYFNSLFNGFVWEDKTLIINNPWAHTFDIFSLKNSFNLSGQYRPITALYRAILYTLFSDTPFFYHFIQVILHSINAVLVFLIFKHFLSKMLSISISVVSRIPNKR